MKSGDVFTVDAQAIEATATFTKVALTDLQKKVSVGDTFSISKKDKCSSTVIRGTRWVDGKPQKGRPRRFSRATVARLLGEDDSAFEAAQEAAEAASVDDAAAVLEERAAELLAAPEPVAAEVVSEKTDEASW